MKSKTKKLSETYKPSKSSNIMHLQACIEGGKIQESKKNYNRKRDKKDIKKHLSEY